MLILVAIVLPVALPLAARAHGRNLAALPAAAALAWVSVSLAFFSLLAATAQAAEIWYPWPLIGDLQKLFSGNAWIDLGLLNLPSIFWLLFAPVFWMQFRAQAISPPGLVAVLFWTSTAATALGLTTYLLFYVDVPRPNETQLAVRVFHLLAQLRHAAAVMAIATAAGLVVQLALAVLRPGKRAAQRDP